MWPIPGAAGGRPSLCTKRAHYVLKGPLFPVTSSTSRASWLKQPVNPGGAESYFPKRSGGWDLPCSETPAALERGSPRLGSYPAQPGHRRPQMHAGDSGLFNTPR